MALFWYLYRLKSAGQTGFMLAQPATFFAEIIHILPTCVVIFYSFCAERHEGDGSIILDDDFNHFFAEGDLNPRNKVA